MRRALREAVRRDGEVVDACLVITGNLQSDRDVQVDGEIHGDVHCSQLVVSKDATINGNVVNGPGGVITGGGTINGNVSNDSLINPGNSPGTLVIDGAYTQTADGDLLIELAPASSYDQLLASAVLVVDDRVTLEVEFAHRCASLVPRPVRLATWRSRRPA